MALVFAGMHLSKKKFIASAHSFYLILFKKLVLMNQRNGPKPQCVLALCAFLTGAIPQKNCLMFVYVCFVMYGFV